MAFVTQWYKIQRVIVQPIAVNVVDFYVPVVSTHHALVTSFKTVNYFTRATSGFYFKSGSWVHVLW